MSTDGVGTVQCDRPLSVHACMAHKLCSITLVATKVHMILWSFVVLTWMCDTIELVL